MPSSLSITILLLASILLICLLSPVAYTNSKKGKEVLDNFGEYLPKFKKIMPHDYKKMLNMIVQMEEKGLSSEQAQIEAFYAATK